MTSRTRLDALDLAARNGRRVQVTAYDLGNADRTFTGAVLALAREHGGRGALKLVLLDDNGVTYVIGLTMIRSVSSPTTPADQLDHNPGDAE